MPRLLAYRGRPYAALGAPSSPPPQPETTARPGVWVMAAIGIAILWAGRTRYYVESRKKGEFYRLGPFKSNGRARAQATRERRMGLNPRVVTSRVPLPRV